MTWIQPEDFKLIGWALGLLLLVAVAAFVMWRTTGVRPDQVLSRAEWRIVFELFAIAGFVLVLILAKNALSLSSTMYIYGRF